MQVLEQVVIDTPRSGSKRKNVRGGGTTIQRWHTEEDLEIIKKKQDEIRAKYEGQIGGASGDGSNVGSSSASGNDVFSYEPPETGEGNVSVITNPVEEESTVQKGKKKGVDPLESGNSDNFYTKETEVQTGMLV